MIERRVDEHDKRCRRLYFTAQGEQQLSALKARISEVKTHLYRGLSDEQLNMMALGLVALEDNANQFMEDQE